MKIKSKSKVKVGTFRLKAIEQALRYGCKLRGFCSETSLRVIRIEKDGVLKGYGKSPEVLGALKDANKDYSKGQVPHKFVYGVAKTQYLTGQHVISCDLDFVLRKNLNIEVWFENGLFIARTETTEYMIKPPSDIRLRINQTCKPEIFKCHGYTYRANPPSGDGVFGSSSSVTVIDRPKNAKPNSGLFFDIVKVGKGFTFYSAIKNMISNEGRVGI